MRAPYAWRNGSKADECLQEGYVWLSVDGILDAKKMMDEIAADKPPGWWDSGWVPFLDSFSPATIVLDTGGSFGGTQGQIISRDRDSEIRSILHQNFDAWLTTLLAGLEKGLLELTDDGGFWPADEVKWNRLYKKCNPGYPKGIDFEKEARGKKRAGKRAK